MSKAKTLYVCQSCGFQSPKWLGRCPDCGEWNTLTEEQILDQTSPMRRPADLGSGQPPLPISQIRPEGGERLRCGIEEFDRVLGGGIVSGSVVLIGGDPGIGKSTLVLQVLHGLAMQDLRALYVSGEESVRQTKMRADRLDVRGAGLLVMCETSLDRVIQEIGRTRPQVLALDSIQTVWTSDVQSPPGSISQVRESSNRIIGIAKSSALPVLLIGHVTKDGAIAGPRVLEHMVDTVLYFEGDRGHPYRILRAVKNRFGSTNEIGVFEMKESGLEQIRSPSEIFLAERPSGASGSVVVPSMEGTRPVLVELQALVTRSPLAVPRRTTMGVDYHRVAILVAVLEKKAGLTLFDQDIFLNVAGGVRAAEPAVDLGLVASIASSFLDSPVEDGTVLFGEVGLTGEVRAVGHWESRLRESAKLGFTRAVVPKATLERIRNMEGMELVGVESVRDLMGLLF
ncbi:MAG: DNA repair protein RadA [Deltaproteobacteria bacterium]|nr:DNA repair protein RadA [Deltaproteobacteria bacterium]MBW2121345.1 DNA repair protein RadA [Deltaproteobacteria bacterium]